MKWLNKLERKYGRYAIHGLMKYIVIANVIVFIVDMLANGFATNLLFFNPALVMQGQIWRLFTFVLIPPNTSPIWIFFALYFSYIIGNGLEQAWGSFKFNIYYLIGILATVIMGFLGAFITPLGLLSISTGYYLNLSMFLAFATIYPNFEVLVFMVLPVKMKYLALLDGILLGIDFLRGGIVIKLLIAAGIINYFIFFGKEFIQLFHTKKVVKKNKERFKVIEMKDYVRHRCSVCGITERDNPDMEFRYCSKCSGNREYCMNHIKDHEHK